MKRVTCRPSPARRTSGGRWFTRNTGPPTSTAAAGASWSSGQARWTIEAEVGERREPVRYTCNFLFLCSGYYDYDEGYLPTFAGREDFRGQVIHPQHWPADLDCRGRRIVVIGSGATAVTLVPALAETAAHVTMLQRSPSYILSVPAEDGLARLIRRSLPGWAAHRAYASSTSFAASTLDR